MKQNKQITVSSVGWLRVLSILFVFHFSLFTSTAQVGTWRNYLAYHDIQQIQSTGEYLFVMASNGLYQYNLQDQSIVTYDRTNGLSDTNISFIKWCRQAKRLIAVYQNMNIDLVSTDGSISNISDIYTKAIMGDKSINNVTINGQYAYLACGFGIVKVDVKRAEISESYMLNLNIKSIGFDSNKIYALTTNNSVITANLQDNLIDVSNWQVVGTYPAGIFDEDKTDYNKYYETVETLNPGGPKYNNFFNMTVNNGILYTVGGGWWQFNNYKRPGSIQVLDSNKNWTIYQDDMKPAFATNYYDVNSIAVDPLDNAHVMVATCSGVYEFKNGQFQYNYTQGNTDYFMSASSSQNPQYVRTDGIIYDSQGNLYVLNSSSATAIIKRSTSGTWSGFISNELIDQNNKSMRGMVGSIIDRRGLLWFVNNHSDIPSFFCYNPQEKIAVRFDNFYNEDNTNMSPIRVNCIQEDIEGNIWVGTDKGPCYLTTTEMADKSLGVIQYKVPRNDGTNLADYLLAGINISCIAVDGAGRKWFGTAGNGVYLVSADNNTQEQHFTAANSCLLSDNIESLAINHTTGEVFFGTDRGLCSYASDATSTNENMSSDNVWAYPNPVTPGYTGLITITGLSYNADVKIVSTNGALVSEGRSNGGLFTWDGCDKKGRRVASGVYMVQTATNDGKKGTVCKIAVIN